MRVPKGKEIEEVNQKVEEDMQPVRSAGGWWLVLVYRVGDGWLVGDGWFILREKYCWLVADKPNEHGDDRINDSRSCWNIEKYPKETKTWKDIKVVRKDIKIGDLVLKRKKN
jgi:hypothetical protein